MEKSRINHVNIGLSTVTVFLVKRKENSNNDQSAVYIMYNDKHHHLQIIAAQRK